MAYQQNYQRAGYQQAYQNVGAQPQMYAQPQYRLAPGMAPRMVPRAAPQVYQPLAAPPKNPQVSFQLPPGWDAKMDGRSGKVYYRNHYTKKTQWTTPTKPAVLEVPLPPNWNARMDSQGRWYFVNHVTKTTHWDHPNFQNKTGPNAEPARTGKMEDHRGKEITVNDLYKEVLRSVVSDGAVTEAERQRLGELRRCHSISTQDHEQMLKDIGIKKEDFERMKNVKPSQVEKKEEAKKLCVICQDNEADHIILNCMHLCVCEDCSELLLGQVKDKQLCPMCRESINNIKKVF